MATESLVDSKFDVSERFVSELVGNGAPLLAAYWEFDEERDRWSLVLVPKSSSDERALVSEAAATVAKAAYQAALSVFDLAIGEVYTKRARALGAAIRMQPYVGRRFGSIFTNGEYFDGVVLVYFAPELIKHLSAA
jgi:hypothetical protein